MAHKVENLGTIRSGGSKYPWDEWLDGGVWAIKRGEDFDVSVATFRSTAYTTANRRHLNLTSRVDGDTVLLQARPIT